MAQVILQLCDICYENDVQTASTRYILQVTGKYLGIDLCQPHADELIAPLADALLKHGDKDVEATDRSPYRPAMPKKRGSWPCLLCEQTAETSQSFNTHLTEAHGTTQGRLYGTTCPVCGKESGSPQGFGQHIRHYHGDIGASTAAVFKAMQLEDPHQVVGVRVDTYLADKGKA